MRIQPHALPIRVAMDIVFALPGPLAVERGGESGLALEATAGHGGDVEGSAAGVGAWVCEEGLVCCCWTGLDWIGLDWQENGWD